MKHPENLKGLASRRVDDEVGEDPVEKNLLVREIGAAVTTARVVGQPIET
jgi:hypothetical protein